MRAVQFQARDQCGIGTENDRRIATKCLANQVACALLLGRLERMRADHFERRTTIQRGLPVRSRQGLDRLDQPVKEHGVTAA